MGDSSITDFDVSSAHHHTVHLVQCQLGSLSSLVLHKGVTLYTHTHTQPKLIVSCCGKSPSQHAAHSTGMHHTR